MTDLPKDARPTSAALTSLSRIMTAIDTNLLGTVHGGVIMKLVDDVAGAVAQRHSGGPAVTASMDEMVSSNRYTWEISSMRTPRSTGLVGRRWRLVSG